MRSLWKGVISFGLVNIPVRMYRAVEERGVHFRQLHARCGTPIRYRRWCPRCDVEVAPQDIARGYEYAPDRFVLITDEELAGLPLPTARAVEILDFVHLHEIDPIYFERTYYLEPAEGGEKAYRLLRRAMDLRGCVAVAKVALRHKETLACLRTYRARVLALATMAYPDEIRPIEALPAFATLAGPEERAVPAGGGPGAAAGNGTAPREPAGPPGGHGIPAATAAGPGRYATPWPAGGTTAPDGARTGVSGSPAGDGAPPGRPGAPPGNGVASAAAAAPGGERGAWGPAARPHGDGVGGGGDGAGREPATPAGAAVDRELELALHLIDRLTTAFDPRRYRDRYREALLAVVERKLAGREEVVVQPEPAPVIDLMEALRASLEQVEQRRARSASPAGAR